MPISDPDIPVTFLNVMTEVGVPFLVLHGEDRVGTPLLTSDLDLVVDVSPTVALNRVRERLYERGLHTVLIWPYDLGGTCGIFLASKTEAAGGAQIDLLFDPRGCGRYGIKSRALIENGEVRETFPVPAPLDQELYLLRKAACKGKQEDLRASVSRLSRSGQLEGARERVPALFSRAAAKDVLRLLGAHDRLVSRFSIRPIRTLANIDRIARRVLNPSGYWIELVSAEDSVIEVASELEDAFSGYLLRVMKGPRPTRMVEMGPWWITRVLPTKIRAGMFISWASTSRWPNADITIPIRSPVDRRALNRRIVETMAKLASR